MVHSMEPGGRQGFVERDRIAATNYVRAAQQAGVRRTIYLGGIGGGDDDSEHLASRLEVEELLADAGPEFVALRASMIVGAGSSSFGTLVRIVSRLPVLAMPAWRDRSTQPIAIEDVVACLVAARRVEKHDAGPLSIRTGADPAATGASRAKRQRPSELVRLLLVQPATLRVAARRQTRRAIPHRPGKADRPIPDTLACASSTTPRRRGPPRGRPLGPTFSAMKMGGCDRPDSERFTAPVRHATASPSPDGLEAGTPPGSVRTGDRVARAKPWRTSPCRGGSP